jgi:sec-independent protein translocase protein TatC
MTKTFWDHLDELRGVLIRCVVMWAVCATVMFFLRDTLFDFLFAPAHSDFITYRLLGKILPEQSNEGLLSFNPLFINTRLAAQFTMHLQAAAVAGLVVSFPLIVWQMYSFISPALYANEKRATGIIIGCGTLLFVCGIALNYLIIFPFAFRFLAAYQVQPEVVNQIALDSYISTLLILSLLMGILFEMPLVAWALAKAGIIRSETMSRFRRHAVVALTILAAVITPTGDAFTLLLVTVPLYFLYELSIVIIKHT